jgi:hypothetical protein
MCADYDYIRTRAVPMHMRMPYPALPCPDRTI